MSNLAELRELLAEIYNMDGPRDDHGNVVPLREFAAMSAAEIERWDFDRRHLMHRIAKAVIHK